MVQYLDLLQTVYDKGVESTNRTVIKTKKIFGYQTRYDLQKGFPLLTTKKMFFRGIVAELLWFLSGSTNIRPLVCQNVRIWNEWPYAKYCDSASYQNETITEFANKIKDDPQFAAKWGELGPVYGAQWRNFHGMDQITKLLSDIKTNPFSRRLIISAWDPSQLAKMALPPCHLLVQFYVSDNTLSAQLYQRSADVFLGVPFNIASYALLIHLIAQVCHLQVGEFIHTLGDAHLYMNHLPQAELQLTRKPLPLSQLQLNPDITDLFAFTPNDIHLVNYQSHSIIKGKVAV